MKGLRKYIKISGLVIGVFLMSCLIVGMIPNTTSVWKYVETGGNCQGDRRQAMVFVENNYPDWEFDGCAGGSGDAENGFAAPWPTLMTRRVSVLQMIYWKLTGYIV